MAVLKREVGPVVGGEDRLAFDILNARMIVNAGPDDVSPEKVVAAVARTGMRAEPWREDEVGGKGLGFWARRGRTILTVMSGAASGVGVDDGRPGCFPRRRSRRSRHWSPSSAAWRWSATG